jgi:hypothetical protein
VQNSQPNSYWFLGSKPEFERFVAEWQARTLPKRDWSHAAHVAIAAYHVIEYRGAALEKVRDGIIRYNEGTGVANTDSSGYHETLTRFWIGIVAKDLEGVSDAFEGACRAVSKFGGQRDLFKLYYSFDVVGNTTARKTWIAPDQAGPYERTELGG